jgi:hypothetical protein
VGTVSTRSISRKSTTGFCFSVFGF